MMKRALTIAGAVLAAGAVALAVNLLLVGYASDRNDPVGNLSPRITLSTESPATTQGTQPAQTTKTTTAPTTPTTTTSPTTTDDHGGSSGGSGSGGGSNSGHGGGGGDDD
jgi:uncharacterized membrane protein YgcG